MRRFALTFVCFFVLLSLSLPVFATEGNMSKASVSINLSNTVAEYSPMGHRPVADAGDFSAELRYEITDSQTGELVTLPIRDVGSYTVRAYINATSTHDSAEAVASFTVIPAKVYISVPNQTVPHTAMANPVMYSVSPSWATDMLDIKISYYAIKSLNDAGKPVDVPKDMGTYMVHMETTPLNEKVECAGKYLVFTVGEVYGGPVSEEEALLSVPKSFKATVQTVETEYTGTAVVPEYSVNVAAADCTLMFSRIYADGSSSAYTEEPPVDPGDYTAACFVLDTVIGSSRIVINKVAAKIDMKDAVYTYTPEGVGLTPAETVPEGIELKYSAYKYVNGEAGAAVEFPLVECGTYLISASPKDTYRYSYTNSVSYSYITIKKVDPVIEGQELKAVEDGDFKSVNFSVSPDYASYSLSYYKIEGSTATPIVGEPVKAGKYYAVVSVKEDSRVNSATKIYGVIIKSNVDQNRVLASKAIKQLCYLFGVCGVSVAMLHIVLTKLRRKR